MKKIIPGLSLATALLVAACGGGSDGTSAALQPNAASNFSISIPLKNGDNGTRVPTAVDAGPATSLKPMFIDGNSNGKVTLYFDGVAVATISPNNAASPVETNQALDNGGYFKYTTSIGYVNNQPVLTVTGSYATVPGPHTFGAVQTNGPCETAGPLCMPETDGYVLAQGETRVTLAAGANGDTRLYLRGVMQSAYICDAACDGHQGAVDDDGYYHVYVVVADQNGTAITHQEVDGNVIPFDNGSYQILELQGDNPDPLLTIKTEAGDEIVGQSLYQPGTDRANGGYGVSIKFRCERTGTTKLVAKLDSNGGASISPINGFTAQSGVNYPTAGMVLGPVGAARNFGNELTVECTSIGALTIL